MYRIAAVTRVHRAQRRSERLHLALLPAPPLGTAYVVAFNTDVAASKTGPSRPTTRQVDASVRDALISEIIARQQAAASFGGLVLGAREGAQRSR